jgi:hypothetical protein
MNYEILFTCAKLIVLFAPRKPNPNPNPTLTPTLTLAYLKLNFHDKLAI